MSVQTTADEHLAAAKTDLVGAVEHMSEIVVARCYGHDEFNAETKAKHRRLFQELLRIRDEL